MQRMQRPYRHIDFPPLTDEQRKELAEIRAQKDDEIDTSEFGECTGDGGFYYIQSLKMPKTTICTQIDNDTLQWLKKGGKGYQTRLNAVLRWARENNCPIAQLVRPRADFGA